MTFAEYQAIPAINATAIKAGAKSMLHMRHVMTGGAKDETPAMRWGDLVHAAILEPTRFFKELAIWQGPARRGKEWDRFQDENAGATIITADEHASLFAISSACHANQAAHRLIDSSEHEVTRQWVNREYGQAKARLDAWNAQCVIEVKTARDISPRGFARQFCGPLGYDLQCAWYSEAAGGLPVKIIAIESEPPYDVAVYRVPDMALKIGGKRARDIAVRYRECERSGVFPGLAPDGGEQDLTLPEWYVSDEIVADMFAELAADQL